MEPMLTTNNRNNSDNSMDNLTSIAQKTYVISTTENSQIAMK